MLSLSPAVIGMVAESLEGRTFVAFLRLQHPTGMAIKIEPSRALAARVRGLESDTPFELGVIGLIETVDPLEAVRAIQREHSTARIKGDWFQPSLPLLNFIEKAAQRDLRALIENMREVPTGTVGVEELSRLLNLSIPTIYRYVQANKLPHFRVGKKILFLPSEVMSHVRQ